MQAWKKWLLFGVAAGITTVVLGSIAVWYGNRELPWDTRSVAVVSVDDASWYVDDNGKHKGFGIDFAIRSDLDRDITLSSNARIMRRHKRDSALEDMSYATVSAAFLPAGQTAKAALSIEWSCRRIEADGFEPDINPIDAAKCYRAHTEDLDALVIFDQQNRLQLVVAIPKFITSSP